MSTESLAEGALLAATDGHLATITFNNPEKHNALTPGMWQALHDVLQRWADDDAVRVVVLRGAGERAFISGADIGSFDGAPHDPGAAASRETRTRAWRTAVWHFPKPVIASIRGWCLGGGVSIAMQADIRIAGESARFGIPAGRLGLAYDGDMIAQLVSVVGAARARLLLFSADRIDATEAMRIGMVHEIVADAELDREVEQLATRIAANAPLALRAMKIGLSEPGATAKLDAAVTGCLASADFTEGRQAFRERREPVFHGR